jgi:hypothetical protein
LNFEWREVQALVEHYCSFWSRAAILFFISFRRSESVVGASSHTHTNTTQNECGGSEAVLEKSDRVARHPTF